MVFLYNNEVDPITLGPLFLWVCLEAQEIAGHGSTGSPTARDDA